MSNPPISSRVRQIIERELDVNHQQLVKPETPLERLGADSIDKLKLLMDFEDEFDTQLPDTAVGKMQTVSDALELVRAAIPQLIPT